MPVTSPVIVYVCGPDIGDTSTAFHAAGATPAASSLMATALASTRRRELGRSIIWFPSSPTKVTFHSQPLPPTFSPRVTTRLEREGRFMSACCMPRAVVSGDRLVVVYRRNDCNAAAVTPT